MKTPKKEPNEKASKFKTLQAQIYHLGPATSGFRAGPSPAMALEVVERRRWKRDGTAGVC